MGFNGKETNLVGLFSPCRFRSCKMAPRGEQSDQKRDQRSPRPPHRSKSEPVLVSRAAVNMKGKTD